jgi:hypothetical protein
MSFESMSSYCSIGWELDLPFAVSSPSLQIFSSSELFSLVLVLPPLSNRLNQARRYRPVMN